MYKVASLLYFHLQIPSAIWGGRERKGEEERNKKLKMGLKNFQDLIRNTMRMYILFYLKIKHWPTFFPSF